MRVRPRRREQYCRRGDRSRARWHPVPDGQVRHRSARTAPANVVAASAMMAAMPHMRFLALGGLAALLPPVFGEGRGGAWLRATVAVPAEWRCPPTLPRRGGGSPLARLVTQRTQRTFFHSQARPLARRAAATAGGAEGPPRGVEDPPISPLRNWCDASIVVSAACHCRTARSVCGVARRAAAPPR